jgi:hypothetical protein
MLRLPLTVTEVNTRSLQKIGFSFRSRDNGQISDSLLFYPDLLINAVDLLGRIQAIHTTPSIHSIRSELRKKSNHAISIHFLTFCNEDFGQGSRSSIETTIDELDERSTKQLLLARFITFYPS